MEMMTAVEEAGMLGGACPSPACGRGAGRCIPLLLGS